MHGAYYVVPLLINQPTWGGTYIADFKTVTEPSVADKKIGQSFELFDGSWLAPGMTDQLPFAFAEATDLDHPAFFNTPDATQLLKIQTLIDTDPTAVLGSRSVSKFGAGMKTLIKFTQAQNNSYQVHVEPGKTVGHWQAKPESWYYFEDGYVTLGLKPGVNVTEYQQRSHEIDAYARQLSEQIKADALSVADARQQLKAFIDQDHPRRFVNFVSIKKDQIVDLSACGIHHSWEIHPDLPLGNIVYEVQVDVKDENCTLRSFDQGNIKDNGAVRPLSIDEYFQALNTSPEHNQPEKYFTTAQARTEGTARITRLFDSEYYKTDLVEFSGAYTGTATTLQDTFHHVFVKSGAITITAQGENYPVAKGWSVFIPAATGQYQLTATEPSLVLTTSV
ncbi:MAG TPA: hypothetical protein VD999_07335 [Vitreimonas sp.]|nr:hypothetical protein [Vitreimonas sp.]